MENANIKLWGCKVVSTNQTSFCSHHLYSLSFNNQCDNQFIYIHNSNLKLVKEMFEKLRRNIKAGLSPRDAITMAISFFLAAVVLPIGLTEVYGANTTGWNAAVITIFTVLFPILAVVGLAMYWIPKARD